MARWLASMLLALCPVPVLAAPPPSPLMQAVTRLQADDARLQSIGFRLATSNAPLCRDILASSGLLLLDVRGFARPAALRAALELPGDFAVQAAAQGSPAERAGLAAGTPVLSLGGASLDALPARPSGDFARLAAIQDRIDAALSAGQPLLLGLPGREVALSGTPACRSRFELFTEGQQAAADGRRVVISRAMLAEAQRDDEAAFLIAHELAHNILRHRDKLAASGRTVAAVRDSEREADRLAVWLTANAGYDPAAAPAFLRRVGPQGLLALVQEPTHDRFATRVKLVERELAALREAPVTNGNLRDWRPHFAP